MSQKLRQLFSAFSDNNTTCHKETKKRSFLDFLVYTIVLIAFSVLIWVFLLTFPALSFAQSVAKGIQKISQSNSSIEVFLAENVEYMTPYPIAPEWGYVPLELAQSVSNLETLFANVRDDSKTKTFEIMDPDGTYNLILPAYSQIHMGFGLRIAHGVKYVDYVQSPEVPVTYPPYYVESYCGGSGDSHTNADVGFYPQYYKGESPNTIMASLTVGYPHGRQNIDFCTLTPILSKVPPRFSQLPFPGASLSTGSAFPYQASADYFMKTQEEFDNCKDYMIGAYCVFTPTQQMNFRDERFSIREIDTINLNNPCGKPFQAPYHGGPTYRRYTSYYHRSNFATTSYHTFSLVPKHTDRLWFRYTHSLCPETPESFYDVHLERSVDTIPFSCTHEKFDAGYIDADKEGGTNGDILLNFTGAHTCFPTTENLEIGQLVYMTGEIRNLEVENGEDYSTVREWEALPIITGDEASEFVTPDRFYGIFLGNIEGDNVTFPFGSYVSAVSRRDTRVWIGAKGNMRALAQPGLYEAGDYLIPDGKVFKRSDTPGVPLIRCLEDVELFEVGKLAIEMD